MTRLFSITIQFHHQLYTALVSMQQQGHDFCCQVRYMDMDLNKLLPEDQLVFKLSEGLLKPQHVTDRYTGELVATTNKAISEHLQQFAI